MSLAELDGSGDAGRPTHLNVEQAASRRSSWFADLSLAALLVLVPVGLAIGWLSRAGCGPWARSPASRGRSRRPTSRGGSASAVRPTRCAISPTHSTRCSTGSIRECGPSAASSRTPRTSCGTRWRSSGRRSMSRSPARRRRGPARPPRWLAGRPTGCRPRSTSSWRSPGRASSPSDGSRRPGRGGGEVAQEYDAEASTRGVRLSRLASVRPGRRRGPVRAEARPGEPRLERAPGGSSGSVVHCRAGRAGGWLWFGVRDVGRGIAPDDQALVFRRAWRDGAPTAEGEGQGLGLALVRQIAEAHGGTVSVASVPGHGASFVVWLPDRRADAKAVPVPSSERWPTRCGRWTRPPDRPLGRPYTARTPTLSPIS